MKLTEENDICVAYSVSIHSSYSDKYFQKVAEKIISDEKSNVIVLFLHVRINL